MLTLGRLVSPSRRLPAQGAARARGEQGIVGFNLALTIAFALFAVIELSRVVLAATQIDDRVKVIITEVGPGSNVSRLDETQKLNETGRMAEEILVAAQNLSARAGTIIETAQSIDGTVSQILQNARRSTARSGASTARRRRCYPWCATSTGTTRSRLRPEAWPLSI